MKNFDGAWLDLLKHHGPLETTFVGNAVDQPDMEPSAKRRADLEQRASE